MTTLQPTIDAHAHVFRRGLGLAAGRRYTPDYDAPLGRYLEKLDLNGLSHGVLVQPSFLGTNNSYLVDCLRRAPERLRGVAVVDPAAPGDELLGLQRAGVVGIRLNLVGRPLPDLGTTEWRSLLGVVRRLGWHVEVQRNASDLGIILPVLLDAGVPVVLDHFSLPDPIAGPCDPGFRALLKFGRSRRVWVKLSAPYRLGAGGEHIAGELYLRLRDAFGLERLMWGSDWPHTQFEGMQTYENSYRLFANLIGNDVEFAAVLASPQDLFRFREPLSKSRPDAAASGREMPGETPIRPC